MALLHRIPPKHHLTMAPPQGKEAGLTYWHVSFWLPATACLLHSANQSSPTMLDPPLRLPAGLSAAIKRRVPPCRPACAAAWQAWSVTWPSSRASSTIVASETTTTTRRWGTAGVSFAAFVGVLALPWQTPHSLEALAALQTHQLRSVYLVARLLDTASSAALVAKVRAGGRADYLPETRLGRRA